jgi:hypothetical protein
MAISSPQIVQPTNTGSNALMQLAQILGQSGQFKQSQAQQQSQFDQIRSEQQSNARATLGVEQDKFDALQVQQTVDRAEKGFNRFMADDQLVKTFGNKVAANSAYKLGVTAGFIPETLSYEDWYQSAAPSQVELNIAGGDTLAQRKLNEEIENNEETIRVRDEGLALEAQRNKTAQDTLVQTIASETDKGLQKDLEIFNQQEQAQGKIDLEWAKLGLNREKAEAAGFNLKDAQDHRKTMDSTVEIMDQINDAVFNLDGKITHRTLFDINTKKRELQPRIEAYNKLADLYGTDRIIYKQSDVKRTKDTKNFFPITVGFEGKIKPIAGNPNAPSAANVPESTSEWRIGTQTYTQDDRDALEAAYLNGDESALVTLSSMFKVK